MPMRNAAAFVEDALRSVLAETNVPLEVIVVDDGSTDSSRTLVDCLTDPRIRVMDGPCLGIAAAYNTALAAARGDIVMRCDADDLYPVQRIALQVGWLDRHSEFCAVCGSFSAIDRRGGNELQFSTSAQATEITNELFAGITRTHFCSFAVRTNILRKLGGMRSYFQTGEDIDLQLRIGEICRVWYSPEVAYRYRIHNSSITHMRRAKENLYFEGLARHFQVQRKVRGVDDLSLGRAPEVPSFHGAQRQSGKAHMQNLLIGSTWEAADRGDYRLALRYAIEAAMSRPNSLSGWRNLLAALVKFGLSAVGSKRPKDG